MQAENECPPSVQDTNHLKLAEQQRMIDVNAAEQLVKNSLQNKQLMFEKMTSSLKQLEQEADTNKKELQSMKAVMDISQALGGQKPDEKTNSLIAELIARTNTKLTAFQSEQESLRQEIDADLENLSNLLNIIKSQQERIIMQYGPRLSEMKITTQQIYYE